MSDREQLIQEITQAPEDLVQAVLEFFYQVKAARIKYSSQPTTLASFVGVLKDSPSFQGDAVIIQREMRDEWD